MQLTINMDHVQQRGQELLGQLLRFSVQRGAPRCYQNWTPETLSDYFCFHARQGTLTWVSGARGTGSIGGTAVAWQVSEARLRAEGEYRFDWEPQDLNGDCVFFADVVAELPADVLCLLASFAQRFPHWRQLQWFTYRRGRLVRLHRRHLTLFLRKTQNYVERQSA